MTTEILDQAPETTSSEPIATPSEPPGDDDGRDALEAAISESIEPSSDAGRDEKGRFVSAKAPETGDKVDAEDPEPKAADPAPDARLDGWSDEHRAAFQAQTPEAQKLIIDRQEAIGQAVTEYANQVQAFADKAGPFLRVVESNGDYFDQFEAPPEQIIANLIAHERVLRSGTYEQKLSTLLRFANDYGVPLQAATADPLADPAQPGGEQYPMIHDLRQQLMAERAKIQALEARQSHAEVQTTNSRIAAFAAERDAQGQPKYPFFEQVRGTMGRLMSSGSASTLQQAYEMASAPINAEIAKRSQAASVVEAQRKATAVEKAKRAAPIRTSGSPRGTVNGSESLDEILASVIQ